MGTRSAHASDVGAGRSRGRALLVGSLVTVVVLLGAAGAGYGLSQLAVSGAAAPTPSGPVARASSSPLPSVSVSAAAPTPSVGATAGPSATPRAGSSPREHVVARGESLNAIARRYGVTVARLIEVNALSNPDVIVPGQRLVIPAP